MNANIPINENNRFERTAFNCLILRIVEEQQTSSRQEVIEALGLIYNWMDLINAPCSWHYLGAVIVLVSSFQ